MEEFIITVKDWFLNLGEQYGVNPIIFGSIYVGAIPFFTISIAWLIKNYRLGKSIVLPVISSILFFISSYIYLAIVGENIPKWVYVLMVVLILFGAYSTYKKVKNKIVLVSEDELVQEHEK